MNDIPKQFVNRIALLLRNQLDNTYVGVFNDVDWFTVTKNGSPFDPAPSLKIRNHSPDGFAWGYGGSGPAQLALALLLAETGDADLAQHFYQYYKFEVIAGLPKGEGQTWTLTTADILDWLRAKV